MAPMPSTSWPGGRGPASPAEYEARAVRSKPAGCYGRRRRTLPCRRPTPARTPAPCHSRHRSPTMRTASPAAALGARYPAHARFSYVSAGIRRNPGGIAARRIVDPLFGQVKPHIHRRVPAAVAENAEHRHLAVVDLAQTPRPLPGHPDRTIPLLGEAA